MQTLPATKRIRASSVLGRGARTGEGCGRAFPRDGRALYVPSHGCALHTCGRRPSNCTRGKIGTFHLVKSVPRSKNAGAGEGGVQSGVGGHKNKQVQASKCTHPAHARSRAHTPLGGGPRRAFVPLAVKSWYHLLPSSSRFFFFGCTGDSRETRPMFHSFTLYDFKNK